MVHRPAVETRGGLINPPAEVLGIRTVHHTTEPEATAKLAIHAALVRTPRMRDDHATP